MANNRMFLVNKRTGTRISLAKYYPSTGWYMTEGMMEAINQKFDDADFGHLTPEAREANNLKPGFGPPHSMGGMFADEWVLEYGVGGAGDELEPRYTVTEAGRAMLKDGE
jgi:hypothetical protein